MADHPPWCDLARCTATQLGGTHRGAVTPVGDSRKRPLATVWLEEVDGEVRVGLAVGHGVPSWTPEDALRVAAAVEQVAGPVVRERERV